MPYQFSVEFMSKKADKLQKIWLIYRGFLAVGKVGKIVRPVARFLTSEKDLFRRTNV